MIRATTIFWIVLAAITGTGLFHSGPNGAGTTSRNGSSNSHSAISISNR